jgi:hypothetical protein
MDQDTKFAEKSLRQRIGAPISNLANRYLSTFGIDADWRAAPFDVLREQGRLLDSLSVDGFVTTSGPLFQGLRLSRSRTPSDRELLQKALGIFEVSLRPCFEAQGVQKYLCVLNVGSVDGYYAMGLSKKFRPEVVHVVEPSLDYRSRLMANIATNVIDTDVEVDAFINSEEVVQIARIYERLLVLVDDPRFTSVVLNAATTKFLRHADIIIETTGWERSMEWHEAINHLQSTHRMSIFADKFVDLNMIDTNLVNKAYDYRSAMWNGKLSPKTWLFAQAASSAE